MTTGSAIDHPFHIHINPFQLVEVFDPSEKYVSKGTGNIPPRYVTTGDKDIVERDEQCFLDPANVATWKQCKPKQDKFIWHDVFAIPSARNRHRPDGDLLRDAKGEPVVIPGYFRMRSRFVDYPGLYVMHCHILIHEDRGMMFIVEVVKAKPVTVQHH